MPTEAVPPATPISPSPPSQTSSQPPRRWRQLALLGGLLSVDNGEASVLSVLFPALRAALGLPMAALGGLIAAGKLVAVVAGPAWVAVARRWPRKQVLAVCCGFWGVWTAAAGLAQNFTQLLILTTVAAAGAAGGGPLTSAMLSDLFDDRARGRAAGLLYGLAGLGVGVAGPLLGLLSDVRDGWRYGFFASGAVQVLFGVLVLLFLHDPGVGATDGRRADKPPPTRAQLGALLRNRTLLLICAQRLTTGQFILFGFGVTFLVQVRGFSNAAASVVTLPVMLCYLGGTVFAGVVADRVHRRAPRTGRIAMMQTALIVYGLLSYVASQVAWEPLWAYVVLFGVLGAVQGSNPAINRPIIASVTLPELRGAAFALMLSVEAAGWALTSLLVGYLGDAYGLQTAFLWLTVVLILANGALVTLLYRPYARDSAALQAQMHHRTATHETDHQ
ncbi:MFS transporter [Streptomyces sp. NPDC087300]|uniref:MFS transporter n=1 Tax=Streptomyces sp. NPDC087300 TaxID=3365780 RepID=UPI0037F812C5